MRQQKQAGLCHHAGIIGVHQEACDAILDHLGNAANRARYVIQNYQETPSVVPALQIMVTAYRKLELPELASSSLRVLAENYPLEAHAWGERDLKERDPALERTKGLHSLR